jgi:hypothetical protein
MTPSDLPELGVLRRWRRLAAASSTFALAAAAAASAGCNNSPGSRDVACRPISPPSAATVAQLKTSPFTGTVFTIVMENHSASEILGPGGPPYINSLAAQGAVAAGYHDPLVHPSEPNYLWMTAGENFGILDDNTPVAHPVACTAHIADQIEQAALDWRAYEESMGTPCNLNAAYPYEPKHDPFVFYDDLNGWDGQQFQASTRCTQHVVDYSELATDLTAGTVPKYVFITPNMVDDMHDGSVQQGDAWLQAQVPKILASPAYKNGGVLFLLWDEGSNSGDDPPFLVVSPLAKAGYVSHTDYDTSSYLKTVEAILGLQPLPCDPSPDSVPLMSDLFSAALP